MAKDKLYLFANWKMYLDQAESVQLAQELKKEELPSNSTIVLFPSALAAASVMWALQNAPIAVGAQNVYWVEKGGYTGEVSAMMYKSIGCSYALVGHSERRHIFHESNHDVRQKLEALLAAGLTPVVCVGETIKERQAGQTEEVVEAQLRAAFGDITWPDDRELVVAYEPVWAIGTGEACDPAEAERMSERVIKDVQGLLNNKKPVVVYGGSVRPENVQEYITKPSISGVLVGQASTKSREWLAIMRAVQNV